MKISKLIIGNNNNNYNNNTNTFIEYQIIYFHPLPNTINGHCLKRALQQVDKA